MKMRKDSLKHIVSMLNEPDADGGGLWLPAIQRSFVWSEVQICQLFDSILREYPISTLLIWRTKSPMRRRTFIDLFWPKDREELAQYFLPVDSDKKCLVLDGQQRLQSLFIGLKGSYGGRELHLNMLTGDAG